MTTLRLRRALVKWGNGFGIRVTRAEMKRLHARERTPVDVEVRTETPRLDLGKVHFLRLGPDASKRHGELAEQGADADN